MTLAVHISDEFLYKPFRFRIPELEKIIGIISIYQPAHIIKENWTIEFQWFNSIKLCCPCFWLMEGFLLGDLGPYSFVSLPSFKVFQFAAFSHRLGKENEKSLLGDFYGSGLELEFILSFLPAKTLLQWETEIKSGIHS